MIICYLLFVIYFLLIFWLITGIDKLDKTNIVDNEFTFKISVIIAVKNEEKNIESLIQSLINQNYPKEFYEIIFVNDNSVDKSIQIIEQYMQNKNNISIINLNNIPRNEDHKMHAISVGIKKSKGDLILTTDGDCIPEKNWIIQLVSKFKNVNVGVVCSHTPIIGSGNIGGMFQIENLAQDAFGALAIANDLVFTCNGRSLAYRKEYFESSKGYKDIYNIIGGDDDLLLHRIVNKEHCLVKYVISKDSFVNTKPPSNINSFINQRLRYASKGLHYYNLDFISKELKLVMPFMYIINLITCYIIISLYQAPTFLLLFLFLIKFLSDYILIFSFSKRINYKIKFFHYLILSLIHPFYILIFSTIGPFKSIQWKNK